MAAIIFLGLRKRSVIGDIHRFQCSEILKFPLYMRHFYLMTSLRINLNAVVIANAYTLQQTDFILTKSQCKLFCNVVAAPSYSNLRKTLQAMLAPEVS